MSSPDRNKTQLTHDVTATVATWLDVHGFRPVESEVQVAPGWCADLAGVITPTQTELIGSGSVSISIDLHQA